MYNFYTLNNTEDSSSQSNANISLDINEPLINDTFYSLFEAYYRNPSEETENKLGAHINAIDYLIGILPDDNNKKNISSTQLTISKMDDLHFLISTTEDREVFLPAFTDSNELMKWYTEPVITLKVPAAWLWHFVLNQKNFSGIVFNPGTIGWDITLEHIQSLLDDLCK